MKKCIFTLMTIVALLMCGCEKDPNPNNGNNGNNGNDTPTGATPDVSQYLGKYLMTRSTELTITVANMFNFPVDRDFDVETLTIAADPAVEYGVILTSSDGMYIHGVVDTIGLHLDDELFNIDIDTTVASIPIDATLGVSLSHPVIPAPVDGVLDWTSTASGSVSIAVPVLGNLTGTITGNMRYRSVFSSR